MSTAGDPVAAIPDMVRRACPVTAAQAETLMRYGSLLQKWQKAKNLVANGSLDNMAERHFLDSAQLVPLLPADRGAPLRVLDIGSGAGFPGLVMAMLAPIQLHSVEANAKKGAFMRQVCRETGVDARIHMARFEELTPFPVDVVISRACSDLAQLLEWAEPFCDEGTRCLFLKGARAEEELTHARRYWKVSVQRHASLSDPSGVILDLTGVAAHS
ncbi:16S rRNA (guanine(527)-N(7))-methyltransferase RsmG [Yunchengibacter salinarum]|uniref:16S rRNA (guanine(527)-N(7))-methyltransferase RsmG n=1 Tax=Yunchengibacter salinarum TaxID=3133399 RepID=UPI0035B60D50